MELPAFVLMRGVDTDVAGVVVAGGEYIISPENVASRIGGGDLQQGHKNLDDFVIRYREMTVQTLKKLPGPKKD